MNIVLKWVLLVGLNTILSFLMAFDFMKSLPGFSGVLLGIMTIVSLYIALDKYLENKKKSQWRASLMIGVGATAMFQIFPPIFLISGAISLEASAWVLGIQNSDGSFGEGHTSFLSVYFTTVIDGILLSGLVIIMVLLVRLILLFLEKDAQYSHDK